MQFADQADPLEPQQQHVVGAVFQLMMGNDAAQARHGKNRRPAFIVGFPARTEYRHGDQLVIGQGLFEQRAIARLEDVQGLQHVGKHHQVGQRE